MPAADSRPTVSVDRSTLSHDSVTCGGPSEVSSTAFDAQPPDLPPLCLVDAGFAVLCQLGQGTSTPKLSNTFGTQNKRCRPQPAPLTITNWRLFVLEICRVHSQAAIKDQNHVETACRPFFGIQVVLIGSVAGALYSRTR